MQRLVLALLWCAFLLTPEAAFAHAEGGIAGGFVSGFTHPVLGWDHVVAMVAVGLWGAFLGVPAIWLLPVVFPMVMAFGAALGILAIPIPAIEVGIAGSAIVLGLLILLAARLPLWLASVIVGAFAIFHGYAHGAEIPTAANPFAYGIGFVGRDRTSSPDRYRLRTSHPMAGRCLRGESRRRRDIFGWRCVPVRPCISAMERLR